MLPMSSGGIRTRGNQLHCPAAFAASLCLSTSNGVGLLGRSLVGMSCTGLDRQFGLTCTSLSSGCTQHSTS